MNKPTFELSIWFDDGLIPIELDDYQVLAIQQILGLEITVDDEGFELHCFSEQEVMNRLKKIGIWKSVGSEKNETKKNNDR